MDTKEHLQRSETALAELEAFTKEKNVKPKQQAKANYDAKANCVEICTEPAPPEVTYADLEYINARINYLREDLNYYRDQFYNHTQGHLPKIVGASAMEKALKAIGLGDDYTVEKRVIYASDGSSSPESFLISRKS